MKLKNFDIALITITFRGTFGTPDMRSSHRAVRETLNFFTALNFNLIPAYISLTHLPLFVIFRIIKGCG